MSERWKCRSYQKFLLTTGLSGFRNVLQVNKFFFIEQVVSYSVLLYGTVRSFSSFVVPLLFFLKV